MTSQEQFQIQVMQLFGELNGEHRVSKDGAHLASQFQKMVEEFKSAQNKAELNL